jgi:hypothetical protein
MGICKSINRKGKDMLKRFGTLNKSNTLKRGETFYGRKKDQEVYH